MLAEQEDLLKEENLDTIQSIQASYSLCEFDYDPIRIFPGTFVITQDGGGTFWHLDDIAGFLGQGKRLGFRVSSSMPLLESYGEQKPLSGIFTYYVMGRGKFNDVELENGVPKNPLSMIGVIHRKLKEIGRTPTWTTIPNAYSGPFGKCDCLEVKI